MEAKFGMRCIFLKTAGAQVGACWLPVLCPTLPALGLTWWLRYRPQCGSCGFDPWVRKIPLRRKWQATPVLLPGKFHGWRSLVGYSPWGRKESDTTDWLHFLPTGTQGHRWKVTQSHVLRPYAAATHPGSHRDDRAAGALRVEFNIFSAGPPARSDHGHARRGMRFECAV